MATRGFSNLLINDNGKGGSFFTQTTSTIPTYPYYDLPKSEVVNLNSSIEVGIGSIFYYIRLDNNEVYLGVVTSDGLEDTGHIVVLHQA